MKQNTPQNKKSGTITRSERSTSNQLVESMLTEHKSKIGDVIHVVINERTTIELPASLSKDEIEARVENYKKLHKSKE
ncbi:MAG: hypothetical protein LBU84_13890 [Prevotella sp.]|jgi:predicted outer membrane protein|nr:hypothetical protein [Prevotella sp.]